MGDLTRQPAVFCQFLFGQLLKFLGKPRPFEGGSDLAKVVSNTLTDPKELFPGTFPTTKTTRQAEGKGRAVPGQSPPPKLPGLLRCNGHYQKPVGGFGAEAKKGGGVSIAHL